jgi:hypothetical protein
VYSKSTFFTDEAPDLGEPITIFAFVGYVGQEPAEDVDHDGDLNLILHFDSVLVRASLPGTCTNRQHRVK